MSTGRPGRSPTRHRRPGEPRVSRRIDAMRWCGSSRPDPDPGRRIRRCGTECAQVRPAQRERVGTGDDHPSGHLQSVAHPPEQRVGQCGLAGAGGSGQGDDPAVRQACGRPPGSGVSPVARTRMVTPSRTIVIGLRTSCRGEVVLTASTARVSAGRVTALGSRRSRGVLLDHRRPVVSQRWSPNRGTGRWRRGTVP